MCYRVALVGFGLVLAGCSGRSRSAPANDRAATSGGGECPVLMVADIKAVTGAAVKPIARGSRPGAGGTCANYATANGDAYLGVSRLTTQAEYTGSVAAVPTDVYPTQQKLAGIGDEGILFSGPGHIRYLVARKGSAGIVIFPLTRDMSDEQLQGLAKQALTRR